MSKSEDSVSKDTISGMSVEPLNQDGRDTLVTIYHTTGHECQGIIHDMPAGEVGRLPAGAVAETIVV